MKQKRVAILGCTGSIGRQTLEVISSQESLRACALGAGSNWRLLAEQARSLSPELLALADEAAAEHLRGALPAGVELLSGPGAMTELVRRSRPDVLLTGVVGAAGLKPTLAGIECGATLAIANKETLVMAGALVMPAARQAGVEVIPVDSEHSAIFQCLSAGQPEEVRQVVITASGGALRDWDARAAAAASLQDALNHPTWNMGRKITIDSATLMNKALEIVEAHWLFDLPAEKIKVVLHPESIVHSYVEFCDGSIIAQLGPADMTVPIAYALCYPRRPRRSAALDLPAMGKLSFAELPERFARAVQLGYRAVRDGGLAGAVLNGANEAAVEAFGNGRIDLGQIVPIVEKVMDRTPRPEGADEPDIDALIAADTWAREQVAQAIVANKPDQPRPVVQRSSGKEG